MKWLSLASSACLLSVAAIVGQGCMVDGGASDDVSQTTNESPSDDFSAIKGQMHDVTAVVPAEGIASSSEAAIAAAAPTGKRKIFLNRNGGTYTPGQNDSSRNISSIPTSVSTIPPYEKGDAAWSQLLACVKDQFSPFNIEVTDVDPGSQPHVECVVGGVPGDLGQPNGVGGIAPIRGDCGIIEQAIVYTFSQQYRSPQAECETAAQEIAHAYGLDHEYLCADPMTYLSGCGNKKFQDQTVACGEYSPRACRCGGQQNSVQNLLGKLGPNTGGGGGGGDNGGGGGGGSDTVKPTVSIASPANGATLPGNTQLTVSARASDNVSLSKVELRWNYSGNTLVVDCAAPPQGMSCTHSGDTFTWTLNVGTGTRTFSVRAVDGSGNEVVTANRTITLGGGTTPPGGTAPSVQILQPTAGAAVSPGGTLPVRVTVKDDGKVAQVSVNWTSPAGTMTLPLGALDATTWGTDLPVSPQAKAGSRTLSVTAVDDSGQKTTSPEVPLQIK